MILTLTPNPTIDYTIFTRGLKPGDVNRFRDFQIDPAGKGINVTRMVHRLGWPTIAFGFIGGDIGHMVELALDSEGVQYHFVMVPGQTRLNINIMSIEGDDRSGTNFYGPGPTVDGEHHERLDGMLRFWLQAARLLVLAGSLPPGVPPGFYAAYIRLAREQNIRTILDTSGEALRAGLAERPDLVKPNREELEELLGHDLSGTDEIIRGARDLARAGTAVVVSLGAEGAICAQGEKTWLAAPPRVELRSTVGSGDSFVAGLALSMVRGEAITEGLRLGSAAGAATAMARGTALGTAPEVASLMPLVRIEEITG